MMTVLGRIIALFMVLALSAGLVAHAAQAGTMASMMAPISMDQPMSDDCDACGDAEMNEASACSFVCVANPALVPGSMAVNTVPLDAAVALPQTPGAGLNATPDPYPPKRLVL